MFNSDADAITILSSDEDEDSTSPETVFNARNTSEELINVSSDEDSESFIRRGGDR